MTPRCSTACGYPATWEALRPDGAPFEPRLFFCETGAIGIDPKRRLQPADFGLPVPTSRSQGAIDIPGVVERHPASERPDLGVSRSLHPDGGRKKRPASARTLPRAGAPSPSGASARILR